MEIKFILFVLYNYQILHFIAYTAAGDDAEANRTNVDVALRSQNHPPGISPSPNNHDESTVPRQPSWMQLRLTSQGIVVTWAPPLPANSSSKIRGYLVGFGVGRSDVFRQNVSQDARSYTIKNTRPSSEYVVTLRAFNNAGEGVPIYETIITIPEQQNFEATAAILPPLGVKAVVLSANSVWLSWVEAPDSNPKTSKIANEGKIYVARWTAKGKKSYTLQNVTAKSLLVEDLRPNTEYEFNVKIVKPNVASAWSLSAFNKTYDIVMTTYPRDLTVMPFEEDVNTVVVSWQPPRSHGGQITGYQLAYATVISDSTHSSWVEQNFKGDRLSATIRPPISYTPLVVKIRAKNNAGYGPFSPLFLYKGRSNYESIDLAGDLYKNSSTSDNSMAPWILWATITGLALVLLSVVILIVALLKSSKTNAPNKTIKQEECLLASVSRPAQPPDVCGFVEVMQIQKTNNYVEDMRNNYLEYHPLENSRQNSELSFEINKPLLLNDRSKLIYLQQARQSPDLITAGTGRQTYNSIVNSPIKISKYLTEGGSAGVKSKYSPPTGALGENPPALFFKNLNVSDYEIVPGGDARFQDYRKKSKDDDEVNLEEEMTHLDRLMHNLNTATNNQNV